MKTEELLDLMRNRRTVRNFLSTPIEDDQLERILKAATLPPSGAGLLPYSIVAVTERDMKARMRSEARKVEEEYHANLDCELKERFDRMGITTDKTFLTQAPVLLVVAGDTTAPYWKESTWLSVAYIILAVQSEGLATVTYTPPDTNFLRTLMDIPSHFSPEVLLPVGHPITTPRAKKERPKGKIYHERYG